MSKISIIIATHSRPQLLPRAVKSAFEAGRNVEVIVVDDASTDETAEVCNGLKGIKYIRTERNQRVAGARNIGILASKGDYITFHDDDDLRIAGSLDKQAAILDENPNVALVYGQALIGDDNCQPLELPLQPEQCPQGDVFWEILSRDFISCGTALFRKECIYKIGLMEKELHRFDDWDFWIRLAEIYPFKALEEPVYIWRGSSPQSEQGTSNLADMFLSVNQIYRRRWMELPRAKQASVSLKKEVYEKARHWMSSTLIWEGITAIQNKNLAIAVRNFRVAAQIAPKLLLHPKTLLNIVNESFAVKVFDSKTTF